MIDIKKTLVVLGIKDINPGASTGINSFGNGEEIVSYSPVDGKLIGKVVGATQDDYDKIIGSAKTAFNTWRLKPAPLRGEIVRQFGEKLRKYKQPLGRRGCLYKLFYKNYAIKFILSASVSESVKLG